MMLRWWANDRAGSVVVALFSAFVVFVTAPANAVSSKRNEKSKSPTHDIRKAKDTDGVAEARLIEILRLIGMADTRNALSKAEKLVSDFPNFQLDNFSKQNSRCLNVKIIGSF